MPATIRPSWRRLTGDTWLFDPAGASARIPAIAVCLATGLVTGHTLASVLAAGGALTVGFGAPLDLRGSRSLLLAATSVGIGASAVAGSLAAPHVSSAALLAGALGLLCALAASRSAGAAWLALQCGLAGVIAMSFPASITGAANRDLQIVVGGFAQTAVLLVVARLAAHRLPRPPPPDAFAPRYAIELALALAVATVGERALALPNGYWAPMTTLLVLRPGGAQTMSRTVARVAGTVAGAGLASIVLVELHPARDALAILIAIAAFGSYLFQQATVWPLLCVRDRLRGVFTLSLAGQSEKEVAIARVVATGFGGGIASWPSQAVAWALRALAAARRRS